jgi:hypothetical protein
MSVVAAIAEKIRRLDASRARWNADGMTCWLFRNDHTPDPYDSLGDYDTCAVHGITGLAVSWPYPAADKGDGDSWVRGVTLTFQPTDTSIQEDVYGWFTTSDSDGTFQFAERFDTPFLAFGSTLEPIVLAPQITSADIP